VAPDQFEDQGQVDEHQGGHDPAAVPGPGQLAQQPRMQALQAGEQTQEDQ
jgi:hypothetical protein